MSARETLHRRSRERECSRQSAHSRSETARRNRRIPRSGRREDRGPPSPMTDCPPSLRQRAPRANPDARRASRSRAGRAPLPCRPRSQAGPPPVSRRYRLSSANSRGDSRRWTDRLARARSDPGAAASTRKPRGSTSRRLDPGVSRGSWSWCVRSSCTARRSRRRRSPERRGRGWCARVHPRSARTPRRAPDRSDSPCRRGDHPTCRSPRRPRGRARRAPCRQPRRRQRCRSCPIWRADRLADCDA